MQVALIDSPTPTDNFVWISYVPSYNFYIIFFLSFVLFW